jgi:hypothetical protein
MDEENVLVVPGTESSQYWGYLHEIGTGSGYQEILHRNGHG